MFSYFIMDLSADKTKKEVKTYEKYFWREFKTIKNEKELYAGASGTAALFL